MYGTFLERFMDRVLVSLEQAEEIELVEGQRDAVISQVATSSQGSQLIATLTAALISHPGVEELYIDDDTLKERIEDLGTDWMRK